MPELKIDDVIDYAKNHTVNELLNEVHSAYIFDSYYVDSPYWHDISVYDAIMDISVNNNRNYHMIEIDILGSRNVVDETGSYSMVNIDGLGEVRSVYIDDNSVLNKRTCGLIVYYNDESNLHILSPEADYDDLYDAAIYTIIDDFKIKSLNKLAALIIKSIELHKEYVEEKNSIII